MVSNVSNLSTDVYNKKEKKSKEKKCQPDEASSPDSQEKKKMIFCIFLLNKTTIPTIFV
jgi:hypothetical protein